MKIKKIEKWLMLEQSGELTPRKLTRLGRELEKSEEARRLRADLALLSRSIQPSTAEPDPWAVTKIEARLRREPGRTMRMPHAWKSALAAAACLVIALHVVNLNMNQPLTPAPKAVATTPAVSQDVLSDPLEDDFAALESLILAISGDPLDIMEI